MVARKITPQDAKTLVLLELERLPAPRLEVVQRLVNYVSYHSREQTMEKSKNTSRSNAWRIIPRKEDHPLR